MWQLDLAHSDRARADSATEGAIRIVTAKGRIVGAHILAPSAGEMIHELALAIAEELKLYELAGLVHVYPTLVGRHRPARRRGRLRAGGKLGFLVRSKA